MKEVKIISNQGKSIQSFKFDTKKEAVFFIDTLPGNKGEKTIQRFRDQHLYVVILRK